MLIEGRESSSLTVNVFSHKTPSRFFVAQLSSKEDYGYFFRTIPTELMFGRVMMEFVASRGWTKVAVFYTGDELGSQSKYFSLLSLPGTVQLTTLLFAQNNCTSPNLRMDMMRRSNRD